jgi:hypothetical protein
MKRLGCITALCALAFGAMAPSMVRAQAITAVSPFLPQSGSGGVSTTENSPLELRGIMLSPAGYLFGLFDPVKRTGAWVKLNEAGHDFTVRSHDPMNDAVTVEYQGRVLSLALKTAQISSAPVMQQVAVPGVVRPPAVGPAAASDEQRLEQVAAEVRRRRALRQAAAQQPPPPGAAPAPAQPPQPIKPK